MNDDIDFLERMPTSWVIAYECIDLREPPCWEVRRFKATPGLGEYIVIGFGHTAGEALRMAIRSHGHEAYKRPAAKEE